MLLASGSGCQMCDFLFVLFDFIFFKQKTAYELRISDWSSDVCSSDLFGPDDKGAAGTPPAASFFVPAPRYEPPRHPIHSSRGPSDHSVPRSDERRVGKECVGPCRSRGAPYH